MSKHALAIIFAISASLAVPAVRAAASDYIPLEYIYMEGGASSGQQNNTATHYINTGIVPSGDWSVNAKFASTNTVAANTVYSTLFCARTAGNANSFLFWPHVGSSTAEGVARIDVGSGQTLSRNFISNPQNAITQGERHTVAIKPSSSGKIAGFYDAVRLLRLSALPLLRLHRRGRRLAQQCEVLL